MTDSVADNPQLESQVPPGSGYIPPETALASTGGSAAAGGFSAVVPLAFLTLAWFQQTADLPRGVVTAKPELHNVPLAATLSVAAVVLAGLALALTALAGREPGYVAKTRLPWLRAYVLLGLVGLAAYSLGLDFLARGLAGSYHVATLLGVLFQILSLAAGLYARYGAEAKTGATEGSMRRSVIAE